MEEFRKRTVLGKYLEVFYIRLVLSLKQFKEYKINFWMMLFFDLTLLFTTLISFYILRNVINEVINWEMLDFFLYFSLDLLSWKILWIHNLRNFADRLLRGDLNQYLIRPLNSYFLFSTSSILGNNLITDLFMLSYILILFYLRYTNIILAIFVMLFSWFYFMVFANFFDSISFFMKKFDMIKNIILRLNSINKRFTPCLFEGSIFKSIVYFLPSSVQAFFIIEILKGRTELFFRFFPLLLFTFIFFIFGIILLWHYGLKKYEAFG